jgi:hypothetical protein
MNKIGFIKFTNTSKFWIYVINSKQWEYLKNHLSREENIYIPTFKYERIMPYDVIIIYVKTLGFICTTVTAQKAVPYEELKIRIFDDLAIGKFNVELRDINFFIKPIPINDVFHYFGPKPKYRTKLSFIRKFCDGEFIYHALDNELGKQLLEGVETVSRIDKNIWLREISDTIEKKEKTKKKFNKSYYKAKRKVNTNQYSTIPISDSENISESSHNSVLSQEFDIISPQSIDQFGSNDSNHSNHSNDSNDSECISIEGINDDIVTSMIPILFDPCDEFRWYDECLNEEDFIEEFKSHYQRCNECEINNNNNQSLTPFINCSEITFDIACIDGDEGFENILNAYLLAEEKVLDDCTSNFIRLYVIQEPDHHYDNTILIEWGVKMSSFTKAEII